MMTEYEEGFRDGQNAAYAEMLVVIDDLRATQSELRKSLELVATSPGPISEGFDRALRKLLGGGSESTDA